MAHAAPDRIGNGGGLWGCENPDGTLQSAVLVDFYEATDEFHWTLASPTRTDPFQIVDEVGASILEKFPDYYPRWNGILTYVKSVLNISGGELKVIDDSLYRKSPPRSLCRSGWKYEQFANFNDKIGEVLVQQDYWNSPAVANLDKAGLIWHEVIYRWMREEFNEQDSVRARQIVGVLFSTMPADQARAKFQEILKQGEIDPTPTNPVFVCYLRNTFTLQYFLDYGVNDLLAKSNALRTCQQASGSQMYGCQIDQEKCDSFTSMRPAFTCSLSNRVSNKVFTETGRSHLEAEGKALRACAGDQPNLAVHCEEEPVCN
jgi:hypothetical protein